MRWVALWLSLLGTAAHADQRAIEAAWRFWVASHDVPASTLAIAYNGEPMGTFAIGGDAGDAVPLASLSKAVTGACVLDLIADGLIGYDTPLRDIFENRPDFVRQGGDITIAAALTHTSGLDFDITQRVVNPTLWGAGDMHDRITQIALGRARGAPEFFYNNENYAVLGSVIMEVTGLSIEDACAPRVLDGLDTAVVHPRLGGGLAYSGWAMSMADYVQFASRLEATDDWPAAPLGQVSYGPGVFMRDTQSGTNLWHFGALCLFGLGDFGSYFYALDNGWSVAVWYQMCGNNEQLIELDNLLSRAAYAD